MEHRYELASILLSIVEGQGGIDVTCYGRSMFPLLREGNIASFNKVKEHELQPGDVCLFSDEFGELHIMRIIQIDGAVRMPRYLFRSDDGETVPYPIAFANIIGRLHAVHRNGTIVYAHHWQAKLLEAAALQIPLWPKLARYAANRRYRSIIEEIRR